MLSSRLQTIVSKLSSTDGYDFFDSLVLELQEALNAKHLLIAQLNQGTHQASSLAVACDNSLKCPVTFDTKGIDLDQPLISNRSTSAARDFTFDPSISFSICAPVLTANNQTCGVLVALFENPIENHQANQALSILQLFAGFASRHFANHHLLTNPDSIVLSASERNFQSDSVTGLPDRNYLLQHIDVCAQAARSLKQKITLITISLDNFRLINNTLGHAAGDCLLYQCARRLENYLPKHCTLTRIAGDEFGLLVTNSSTSSITKLGISLSDYLHDPFYLDSHPVKITASIGAAVFPNDALTALDLLAKSDQAANHRKASGKNGFSFYTEKLLQENRKKLQLKYALGQALKNRELEVFYQPIINLQSRRLEKCEALVRWTHEGEKIAPLDFIPIAEEFGLAQELGAFVWETACSQIETFKKNGMGNISISVNRSMAEFPHPNSSNQDWLKNLVGRDIDNSQISFEITETILAPENKSFSEYLTQLKQTGCSISLDDFGTGYSSLSYLRNFPIDYLKIDRSFIAGIDENEEALALVTSIIEMAKALSIKTIAEGVETKGQLTKLDELGCNYIQGFFFSKPIKSDEFIRYSNNFCYETTLQN